MLRWNAKADIETNAIMWAGILIAVLIISYWFYDNIYPLSQEISHVNSELGSLQYILNSACNSPYYRTTHNPELEYGSMIVNESEVCLKTTKTYKCRVLVCDTRLDTEIFLDNITNIIITKENSMSVLAE